MRFGILWHIKRALCTYFFKRKRGNFMERETIVLRCGKFDGNGGFECPNCGNHVCGNCAETNFGLCPHCLSRLYRIS